MVRIRNRVYISYNLGSIPEIGSIKNDYFRNFVKKVIQILKTDYGLEVFDSNSAVDNGSSERINRYTVAKELISATDIFVAFLDYPCANLGIEIVEAYDYRKPIILIHLGISPKNEEDLCCDMVYGFAREKRICIDFFKNESIVDIAQIINTKLKNPPRI